LRDLSPGAVDGLYHVPSTLVSTNMDLLIANSHSAPCSALLKPF